MSAGNDHLERLLADLGKAHHDGAFSSNAEAYPWQAAEAEVWNLSHRRFAWMRVATPLAAAAAVAAFFVLPVLFRADATAEFAQKGADTDQPIAVEVTSTGSGATVSERVDDCDFNGDGVVNGQDIQAFVRSRNGATGEEAELEKEIFQRCLLGQ